MLKLVRSILLRLSGWKPLWASINEERIGILCFEPAHLRKLDVPQDAPAEVSLIGPGADVLALVHTTVGDLMRYGVRVHPYLLEPGRHQLRMSAVGQRWRAQWTAGESTTGQQAIAQACRRHGTPLLFVQDCDAGHYPYGEDTLTPWFDRPDALQTIEAWLDQGTIDADRAQDLRHFVEYGYIEIPQAVDDQWVDAVNAEVDEAAARGHQGYVMGSSQRLEQLHRPPGAIRRLWLNATVRQRVEQLFRGSARPAQTLAFLYGSQQDPHQDTVHLTPFPAGLMCGVWIALQDVEEGSGELVIYPGSHRTPRLRMGQRGCPKVKDQDWSAFAQTIVPVWDEWTRGRSPVIYRPRKGSALIWHENLLHAGSARQHPERHRRSMVIHYYASDSISYADSTGEPAMAATAEELAAGH